LEAEDYRLSSEPRQAVHDKTLTVGAAPLSTVPAYDGQHLRLALHAAGKWLHGHAAAVNALNVFPVPDGDTGTNMSLTMNSALAEIDRVSGASASEVARAMAHGALMGARGNSGVILSQILRGFAHGLEDKETFTTEDVAAAAKIAFDTALRGVIKPVEGTILTVMREVARAAQEASQTSDDFVEVLAHSLDVAKHTLALTPELLAVLKEAGVVDAGGQGLVFLLEGALRFLQGEEIEIDTDGESVVDLKSNLGAGPDGYGYDVQFLIKGQSLDVGEIRDAIDAMGDSTLVVGDSQLVKVHVHVHDPSVPLAYGVRQGIITDVVVENMQEQYQDFVLSRGSLTPSTEEITDIAIVAVVPGEGLVRIFESMGVGAIVSGGQTMNPSTQEILAAVEGVQADKVLVLPNNKNVILAARQACELSSKQVAVVPTKTIPEGISALMAFNYQADLHGNAERMMRNAAEIQTIEITYAVRTTQVSGLEVKEGDVIGLLNDELVADGDDQVCVALDVLGRLLENEYEVATIYYGQDVTKEDADVLAQAISEHFPDLEVDTYDGGQAYYHYILSLE
jgi:uncharacterized protein